MARGGRGRKGADAPEIKVSGRHACAAMFARRPDAVIRAYLTEDAIRDFSDLLKALAARRRAYHVVDAEELDRVADTRHHEGICLLARRPERAFEDLLADESPAVCLLVLDGIQNPHNLGAVLRTAAHFGVLAVLVDDRTRLTPAAHRVAEGGAAWVDVVSVPDLPGALGALRARGYRCLATAGDAPRSLYEERLEGRVAVVLGGERPGVSPAVAAACDARVAIPGTGRVESLNVSAACAVVLGEVWRQR